MTGAGINKVKMMKKIGHYFNSLFPFVAVLFLWRLSSPLWNPGGILVLIPVFYYSLVRPRDFFVPMAVLGTILLDYNFDTVLYWTILYCLFYVINGFQSYIDMTRQKYGGLYVFMIFYGLGLFLLGVWGVVTTASFYPGLQIIWLFCWGSVLYMVFVKVMGHK